MHAKVNLHDITRLQNNILLTRIRGIMRDAVVQRESRGEPHSRLQAASRFQASIFKQRSHAILDPHGNIRESPAGSDSVLRPASDLAVYLCCFAVVIEELVILKMTTRLVAGFLGRRASRILDHGSGAVALDLARWVLVSREEVAQRNSRWRGLFQQ